MTDEPGCQLRRRKMSGNPNLPLNLDVEYLVSDGGPDLGTPSPSVIRRSLAHTKQKSSSSALLDYKNKQQSFDIQVEECEEEEIIIESEDDEEDNADGAVDRSVTPTPIQDFAANVVYSEGPQLSDFLRVKAVEPDCYTDVSDADSEGEENE